VLIANSPEEFAHQVVAVLSDADLRARLGAAGRRLAVDKYDWKGIVRELERVYESCLAPAGMVGEWAPPLTDAIR